MLYAKNAVLSKLKFNYLWNDKKKININLMFKASVQLVAADQFYFSWRSEFHVPFHFCRVSNHRKNYRWIQPGHALQLKNIKKNKLP